MNVAEQAWLNVCLLKVCQNIAGTPHTLFSHWTLGVELNSKTYSYAVNPIEDAFLGVLLAIALPLFDQEEL
jgi:hypothetical protein